jgi:hypothetical protein
MHDWFDAVKQYFAVFDIFSKKTTQAARVVIKSSSMQSRGE